MATHPHDAAHILEQVRESGHKKVKVAIVDIDGILRGKYILFDKFRSALQGGFGFCDVVFGWDCADVCYDNVTHTGWHTGYPDGQARIDPGTFRRVPWDGDVPFFLADFVDAHGAPLAICPRQLARRVTKRAGDMGFGPKIGLEFEWFNFSETPQSFADKGHRNPAPMTPGMFGYSVLRHSANPDFFNALMDDLLAFGVPIEGFHTETGPGVLEAAILYDDAIEAADRGVLFKSGAKEIAQRHGLMASFMARWNVDLPGCSGHIHQSLVDTGTGDNAFFDASRSHGISELFEHYIAGQMHCLPEILPMYAPTVNSYKRLVEGYWAPTRVTWGVDNRTVALRAIPGGSKSTRLETRVAGADVNPYLGVAAALASGLYGIEKKLALPSAPIVGNGYAVEDAVRLPSDLEAATERMAKSEIASELFGEAFVDHFVNTRRWESRQFAQAVTSWELQRYFEII